MSRKPNIDPGIYQVDLVAGLFGAFMMVWISGAQNSEFPGEGVEPPTYATLTVQVRMVGTGYGGEFSGSPAAASSQSCVNTQTLEKMGLSSLAALPCPAMPHESAEFEDIASFAFFKVASCQGAPGSVNPTSSYKYGRSLQYDLAVPVELRLRGYLLMQVAHGGVLPTFESGWGGNADLLSSIVWQNQQDSNVGMPTLICKPEPATWSEVTIYQVADEFDIWQRASVQVNANGTPSDLTVFGRDAPDSELKRFVIKGWMPLIAWPSTAMQIELCAFRDGSKRCFAWNGSAPTTMTTLTLNRT